MAGADKHVNTTGKSIIVKFGKTFPYEEIEDVSWN
jgi:hypothetical protein